ncbi:MAG: MarR family winged helix-turn-helix transcriptional regulator [Polyangia bacterium]
MKHQDRFAEALSAISRRVSKLQATEICCGGLTREQFETLRSIEATREPSMSALSAALGVDASTMSRNIAVLEREKYVSRARATEDSRVVTVGLTVRGRNALQTLRCDEQDVMARVFRRLPTASRGSIVDALEVVRAALVLDPPDILEGACCAEPTAKRDAR